QLGTFGITRYVDQWLLEEHSFGSMECACTKCEAKYFSKEKTSAGSAYNMCCSAGKVSMKIFKNFHSVLKALFQDIDDSKAKQFRSFIRNHNSGLATAST